MDLNDLILVSVDDHVVEPPDMWARHVSKADLEHAPRVIHIDEMDADVWEFEGTTIPNVGLNAVAGRPPEEYGFEPTAFDEIRKGAYDIHERVRDMNRNGILASMCFPTFAGFSGGMFQEASDKDLALATVQAYNDWHIDEWCAAYPDRFIPLAIPPVWDPEVIAAEVRRVAAKGCRAITMPELPHIQGLPSYIDLDHWAPFFRAVSEEQVVMCLHIGQGFAAINSAPNAPIDNLSLIHI